MPQAVSPLEWLLLLQSVLKHFAPTREGRLRRWRKRRYKVITRLRSRRDRGRITQEDLDEEMEEWDKHHPKTR